MNSNQTTIIKRFLPFVVFIWSFIIYLNGAGSYPVYFYDEAKNAECAREMLENSEWIIPTFNYEMRTDKPPIHYYFMMIAYKLFGINAFAARFFSALMGALTILITFIFSQKYSTYKNALITTLILWGSFHLGLQFHLAVPDPYLIFFVVSSHFLFFDGYFQKNRKTLILAYIAVGFGILSKGPVALILPALSVSFFLICKKKFNLETIRFFIPFWGLMIVLLIALPWYILAHIKTGGLWTESFFIQHNFSRFTATMEGNGGSFLITILYLIAGLFPFSVFLFQAIISNLRFKKDDFMLFALCTAGIVTLFFLFSKTRLPNYTVPTYPFFAIIIARYLTRSEKFNFGKAIPVIIFTLLFVGMLFMPDMEGTNEAYLTAIKPYGYVLWGITAGFALSLLFIGRKILWPVLVLSIGSMVSLSLVTGRVFPEMLNNCSVIKGAQLLENSENVYYWDKFNVAYSFQIKRKIKKIETQADISPLLENNKGVTVITTQKGLRKINEVDTCLYEVIFSESELFSSDTTVIFVSR
ncbi:MAG: glycosyltransferase family 39 protein [Prolixibacteraceae bacterium]|nr:glycosyltransferase family 39 protein [Prolixibacteraceae bacterium]